MNAPAHAPTTPKSPPTLPPEVVRKRRLQLVMLAFVFFAPLGVAMYMYYSGNWQPSGRVNHGELVSPARPLPDAALPTPAGTPTAPDFLRGKWSLVYVADGACDATCRQAIDDMRATRLALDHEAPRVQRVFLYEGTADATLLDGPQKGLIAAGLEGAAGARLRDAFPPGDAPLAQRGRIYVVDPHANLMMSYPTPLDKRGAVKDLDKLLRLSHIG